MQCVAVAYAFDRRSCEAQRHHGSAGCADQSNAESAFGDSEAALDLRQPREDAAHRECVQEERRIDALFRRQVAAEASQGRSLLGLNQAAAKKACALCHVVHSDAVKKETRSAMSSAVRRRPLIAA